MSSVTRLQLLSQSMLNVSCQRQKRCSSLPADSPTESPMEFVGQLRPSGAWSLLGVPGLSSSDPDDDDCEVVIGIRPKSSPLPRRRSSDSDDDSEPEPPLSGSRRVSFADAKGLSLVQVKKFDTWDIPKLPGCEFSEGEGKDEEEYFLSPLTFSLPVPTEELLVRVREQKVELEAVELLPGTTVLRGVIRVLNVSFNKAVYIRTTLDAWSSHFDLLAEYMPGSSDSLMDLFSFKLTLVPPFGEQGARVDFCLRYETPVGTFWANNNNRNYVLSCHQRIKERREKPQKENVFKKSCLKTVCQNFSAVEDFSATEATSQENISTDVVKHEEEADIMKAKQISGGQSEASEEERQKLLIKSKANCSRRSRRKAARVARVRDYFSQRNGGVDDSERDESPPDAKQEAQEEASVRKHCDVRSSPEGKSLETCSEPVFDVQPARNFTSEKSESNDVADSITLTGSESVTGILDNPSNDDPAQCQNINKSVSEAEQCNRADEPADSVISAVSSESLVSQSSSFTFGTVVAPLYHQVSGRVGTESQSAGGLGNPERAQSYPHTERRETTCADPTEAQDEDDSVQENLNKTQKSNQECLDATVNNPPVEKDEEETSLTPNDILDHTEILQDQDDIISAEQRCTNTSEVPKSISGDTTGIQQAVNILNTDLLNPQLPTEGEEQEGNLTHDIPLKEDACIQLNLDETPAESKAQELTTSLETLFKPLQLSQSASGCISEETNPISISGANDKDVGKTVTLSTTNAISEEGELFEATNYINNSAMKETENSYISCFEIEEEKDVTTPQISPETNTVEEGNKGVNNSHKHSAEIKEISDVPESTTQETISNHMHEDEFVELRNEDTQKIEHHEMEAADAKQEDFYSAGIAELNWEMMVEEEEKNILTDEEKCEALMVEKDHGKFEDAESETAAENRETTETEGEKQEVEMLEDITAAREKENKAEDADVLECKLRTGEEEFGAGKDREDLEEELTNVQATKTDGEEEEKREEQEDSEEEKLFSEIQEGSIWETNVQHEEEIEWEEEMEIDWLDDNEADVWELENQVEAREGNGEEENPDYKETVESESTPIEDRENEPRLDITQNEDDSCAPVNNVQEKRVTDIENVHTPAEMYLHNEDVTHDLSAAVDESESVTEDGGLCLFTDEPESNQASHDSASAESDSDDEVELYMHCLRAVHVGEQAQKDRSKDAGFSVGKRPSVSRSKLLSTPMPSISESLDEEHLSRLQDKHEDDDTADFQPTAAALPGKESTNTSVSWWRETFSCSNILKTLLYGTLLVVFLVVAYCCDFLAYFGLYLITVVWLYCQGQRQPEQQKQQKNRLNKL
ncbi:uncharacterized protein ppp1r3ab [Centropristis striata]|uniref:uncharacterized protein ppp1r3ab n=1 Tax=Centropristis striata TaxID=184440 RepID=UPI0027DFAAD1|nr:uncharacterized protein ppp1r3ab [Centropristis striata]